MLTIICIGAGPSITREDVLLCERSRYPVMGINNAYLLANSLDFHYAGATSWWNEHYQHTHLDSCKFSMQKNKYDQGYVGVRQMLRGHSEIFSTEWPVLGTGKNSGFAAVNLAYLLGFRRIILLGYDMKFDNGKKHFHPDHKGGNPVDFTLSEWIRIFDRNMPYMYSLGLSIVNVTRSTDLNCFPQVRLEDVL